MLRCGVGVVERIQNNERYMNTNSLCEFQIWDLLIDILICNKISEWPKMACPC